MHQRTSAGMSSTKATSTRSGGGPACFLAPFFVRTPPVACRTGDGIRPRRADSEYACAAGYGSARLRHRSPTCCVAFSEPSVFFLLYFPCILRCARLSLGASSPTASVSSTSVCMRSPHVARRTPALPRVEPSGAKWKALADMTCGDRNATVSQHGRVCQDGLA